MCRQDNNSVPLCGLEIAFVDPFFARHRTLCGQNGCATHSKRSTVFCADKSLVGSEVERTRQDGLDSWEIIDGSHSASIKCIRCRSRIQNPTSLVNQSVVCVCVWTYENWLSHSFLLRYARLSSYRRLFFLEGRKTKNPFVCISCPPIGWMQIAKKCSFSSALGIGGRLY